MFRECYKRQARRGPPRRAFSLAEMLAVVFLIGLIATAAALRMGFTATESADAEGFVRRLALDFSQCRRRAISTGDDHYLQFARTAGVVTGYAIFRDESAGDTQADESITVPSGSVVTTAADTWAFDFGGALTTAGTASAIQVDGEHFSWSLTVYHATGAVTVDKVAQP